jgi:hypothetical protein
MDWYDIDFYPNVDIATNHNSSTSFKLFYWLDWLIGVKRSNQKAFSYITMGRIKRKKFRAHAPAAKVTKQNQNQQDSKL